MATKKLDNSEDYISLGLKPSTKLHNGHYEILGNLGEPGGFGLTYLGYDCKLNTKVAIKEYFPRSYANRDQNKTIVPTNTQEDKADFEWGYNAFKKEAQTIANLEKHPNVIDVKNLFEENGTVYFVMSYTQGIDLEAYLQEKHPLSQKEIEEIIFPFLEGVKHIHKYNLLHRDIKLANVLISKDNQPILIDFGTARNELQQKSKKLTAVYTEGYASLEQHTQGKEGPYTDVYAIGMMMYALVNGITDTKLLPSSIRRFEAMQTKKISLLTFPEDKRFSKEFIYAIKKALEIKKEDRVQTVSELIELLKKAKPSVLKNIVLMVTGIAILSTAYYFYQKELRTTIQTQPPTEVGVKTKEILIEKEDLINHLKEAEKSIMLGNMKMTLYHLEKDPSSSTPKGALRIAELYHGMYNEERNAIIWYEKAESFGYIKAKYPLAILYCKQGNFKKFTQSKGIFEYAKNSRKELKYDIALCYNELGNISQARKWFEASASMGYQPAKENLRTLLIGELGYSKERAATAIKALN